MKAKLAEGEHGLLLATQDQEAHPLLMPHAPA
jgi:hypothetical protein